MTGAAECWCHAYTQTRTHMHTHTQVLQLLESQPDAHPTARGARKHLRQMVQEAHKNGHRRLRQLEVVHAHVGLQPACGGAPAKQQVSVE